MLEILNARRNQKDDYLFLSIFKKKFLNSVEFYHRETNTNVFAQTGQRVNKLARVDWNIYVSKENVVILSF